MKPNARFLRQPREFWANVRTISQKVGYTAKGESQINVPSLDDTRTALGRLGLSTLHIADDSKTTEFGELLIQYFKYRARILNRFVEPRLMDSRQAKKVFSDLAARISPSHPFPMNKQKGKKRTPAYFTSIVNMLIEENTKRFSCDFDPHELTTVTRNGVPLRTLARRVDGAFPSAVNPIAIWEIKEYYNTTTFGSRVADGVYETLLDGMEIEELREHEGVEVKHYLMVDSHFTWWVCGRSYLCRLIDMLHMGFVDEIFFGREVLERLPSVVSGWVRTARGRRASA
ncbi:MAG: hypothetical protein M1482_02850 [Chloroflexi bacterium]|nr:hypothetical protein [Chloroflexota bacterium]